MVKSQGFKLTEDVSKYIGEHIECECGEVHFAPISVAVVESGALKRIPETLNILERSNPLVVSDINTEIAAGKAVKSILAAEKIDYTEFVYPDSQLTADPDALGRALINAGSENGVIIAVGSGTLNDICKYIAAKMRKKMVIAATAASMDGFLTNVSILTLNGLKSTRPSVMPDAMIADTDVIRLSPLEMTAAGVGDMLGKPVSLLDWKIANLINGDKYCAFTEGLVSLSYREVLKEARKLRDKDEQAIANVMNGLILLGFGMAYNGGSQPGSGAEHQLSHFWEMTFAKRGMPPVYHGAKVGIGTAVCLEIWKIIKDLNIDFNAAKAKAKSFNYDKWRNEIERVYGDSCQDVFALEEKSRKNDPKTVLKHIALLEANFNKILMWAENLPEASMVNEILSSMDAPYSPKDIGVDRELFADTIYYAKDMRNRYSVLQILFDLDLQKEVSDRLIDIYYNN